MDRAPGVRTADLLQTKDWQATPLGPRAAWPRSLASYVSMIQALPTPAVVFWGPELVQVYNDGYSAILGQRHPRCFGERFRDAWPDTYPLIHPWLQRVLQRGEVVEVEREHIGLTRHGFEEEAYFTFTFSPLTDDEGRIAGVLHPVFEVTDVVFSDRRADTLRALAAEAHALDPVSHALAALATNPGDITFASIHLCDGPGGGLRYAEGSPGVVTLHGGRPRLEAAALEVLATREPVHLPEPAALLLPLQASPAGALLGVITLGLSRRVPFDARLRVFLETVAQQTAYTRSVPRRSARWRATGRTWTSCSCAHRPASRCSKGRHSCSGSSTRATASTWAGASCWACRSTWHCPSPRRARWPPRCARCCRPAARTSAPRCLPRWAASARRTSTS